MVANSLSLGLSSRSASATSEAHPLHAPHASQMNALNRLLTLRALRETDGRSILRACQQSLNCFEAQFRVAMVNMTNTGIAITPTKLSEAPRNAAKDYRLMIEVQCDDICDLTTDTMVSPLLSV